jgi:flavorubredoxin
MVHWPEVMFSYEEQEKVLFSADAFGKFGALDADEDWACEARRYYMNIVGKYGAQVQAVLKKAAALDIQTICPLHGPILTENLPYYLNLYNTWSSYQPENSGIVIAFASIHGNTRAAVEELRVMLSQDGTKVSCFDLARDDMAEVIEDAFRYDRLVLASPTYDGGLFPPMEDLLYHLKSKNFQNRTIGIVENGSWAPTAGKLMRAYAEGFKNCTLVEPVVTIRSALNEKSREQLSQLAAALKQ